MQRRRGGGNGSSVEKSTGVWTEIEITSYYTANTTLSCHNILRLCSITQPKSLLSVDTSSTKVNVLPITPALAVSTRYKGWNNGFCGPLEEEIVVFSICVGFPYVITVLCLLTPHKHWSVCPYTLHVKNCNGNNGVNVEYRTPDFDFEILRSVKRSMV